MNAPVAAADGAPGLLAVLRCAGCRAGGLRETAHALDCPACGRRFPVQAGVAVLVPEAVAERGPLLDPAVAASVMERLAIPSGPISLLRVRRASGARVRTAMGHTLPGDGHVLAGLLPAAAPPRRGTGEGAPSCEWLREYLPRAVRPGEELLANVQIRNAGPGVMAATGENRITIAAQWTDNRDAPVADDTRTPLPADLAAGQVMTLPIRLHAPREAGRYRLVLQAVQEGVAWLEPRLGPFTVSVDPAAGWTPPAHWVLDGPGPHDRGGDGQRGLDLLRSWMARHAPARACVLELGSGADPAAVRAGLAATVVDGDLLALQLGRLRSGSTDNAVCTDFADLPLAERAFDVAVCFRTLHLLPDPAAVLRNLRGHLRPGGFIALLCEPVGQMWPGAPSPATLAALRRGENPQGFSLAEWDGIFRAARLRVAELVVDGASLKARLEPGDPHA